jgi:hypothetical protein
MTDNEAGALEIHEITFDARDPHVLADQRQADGTGWVVFADPDGNEFCLGRSAAERSGS